MGAKGMKFILIRTSRAGGLQGGERRSQVALTAYPLLMEAYRQIWEEATATDMKLGGAESVWVWTGITVSVRALVRVHASCGCRRISFSVILRDSLCDHQQVSSRSIQPLSARRMQTMRADVQQRQTESLKI